MESDLLIIEDEASVADLLREELAKYYYRIRVASDGRSGLDQAAARPPDLIILDLGLPELDGWDVCRLLKSRPETQAVPLLILTALNGEENRLRGLELGADDYIAKPFSLKEVVSRVRALLRRSRMNVGAQAKTLLKAGPLVIDFERHEVRKDGRLIALTPVEFSLLGYLAGHSGRVFTRDQLITALWGQDRFVEEHNVDVHIHALRRKLEPDPDRPRILVTMRGMGYKLEIEPER